MGTRIHPRAACPATDLSATPVSPSRVNLSWSRATDNVGVTEYVVFRDQRLVARVDGDLTGYGDRGLDPDTEYAYEVRAADGSENKSEASNGVTARTPPADTLPPTAPTTGLTATEASPDYVDLSWQSATDHTAGDGYEIYRDGTKIARTSAVTTYRDTSVPSPADVTYAVSTLDGSGHESPASGPASVRVRYFSDGFESGLGRWDRIAGLTIASQLGASGQYAARATSTGTGVYGFRDSCKHPPTCTRACGSSLPPPARRPTWRSCAIRPAEASSVSVAAPARAGR
jgi:hypothetical protein